MSTHTPGPWDDASKYPGVASVRIFAKTRFIATVGDRTRDREQNKANAHLIAAAPAMEVALRLVQHGLARIERVTESGSLFEFCFDGMRYCMNGDWNGLMDVIGWGRVHAALAKVAIAAAEGGAA